MGERLEALEEHFLVCHPCVDRAEDLEKYIDLMRAGYAEGGEGRLNLNHSRLV